MIRRLALAACLVPMPAAAFTPLDYETCILLVAKTITVQRDLEIRIGEDARALDRAAPAGDNPTATAAAAANTALSASTEALSKYRETLADTCDTFRN